MRRNPLFPKVFLAVFVSALTVFSLARCSTENPPPEFVGTWKGPLPLGTATLTLTETTFTILTADASATATEKDTGTVTSFDTTLKHIQLAVATVTLTGSASAVWHVGDTIFMLYYLSGNTLTIASSTTAYPAGLTGGLVLTKQ